MESKIWELIQDESAAIQQYYSLLESDFAQTVEAEPFIEVIKQIISDERDHLAALQYLYQAITKNKPQTDTTEAAHAIFADFRERNKLIK